MYLRQRTPDRYPRRAQSSYRSRLGSDVLNWTAAYSGDQAGAEGLPLRKRSAAGGKGIDRQRRSAAKPTRRGATKPARGATQPASSGRSEVARLKRELEETLAQQVAMADVLRVISSFSGDREPVFATMLANAVRLSDAHNGVINRWDGEELRLIATHNMPAAFTELRRRAPYRPGQHSASGRMLTTRQPVHIADLAVDQAYLERNPPTVAAVELGGVRTTLAVPMFKNDQLIGSFTVGRREVRPFTVKQIKVVQNFAAQAVVAIENARLLNELLQSRQQQVATADVLKIISHSAFELPAVLDTLVQSAVRLCNADLAAMHRRQPADDRVIAVYGGPADHQAEAGNVPFEAGHGSVIARTVLERKSVHVVDVLAEPDYELQEAQKRLGFRTVLGVPLLREGVPIGVIVLMRLTVRPFTENQIELVENFAAQAVIAIENTRLLTELRRRTDELGRSLAELERERGNKLMNLEAMAAAIAHEVRQPLASIATNGGAALRFLGRQPPDLAEAGSALNRMVGESHRASQVFDNIRALFGKDDNRFAPVDVNRIIGEVMRSLDGELAANRVTAELGLTPDLPPILGHSGQLEEVLVNLVRNAIEAIGAVADDRRLLRVQSYREEPNKVVLAVEDSGPGIDPNQADAIFDAFMTTKAQGMGLGLALCRMIVERHGGQVSASPAEPRGSIFRVALPAARPGAAK
jgi:signal transduction histidine kinase